MSPHAKKRVRLFVVAIALLVAGWLGSASFVASRLTHRRHPRAAETVPYDLRASTQELRLSTSDHEDIGAWFVAQGRAEEPIVVLLHGLGGARSALVPRMRILASTGFGILAVTLRAHGDSSGEIVDVGWSARADVIAAVEWIESHHAGRTIVVDGTSMGAAAAMFAAGDLGERVSGYVLECPYSDLCTAVKNRLELALPPVLDSVAWAGLRTVSPIFMPDMDRIRPIDCATSIPITTPVMILSSQADRHARPDEARAILARMQGHAEILWFDDAAHDRLVGTHPEQWKAALVALVEKAQHVQRERR